MSQPKIELLNIGQYIRMAQHCSFGRTRGAAGILQKCQVISIQRNRSEFAVIPQGMLKTQGIGNMPWRNTFPDILDRKID